ncbi:MAG: sulfotransferase [Rhodospirillales bacterium]
MPLEDDPSRHMLLHIGYHKTGSSFLQRTLFTAGDLGFVSVERSLIDRQLIVPGGFHEVPAEVARRFRDEAAAAAAGGRILVVSHERLSGYPVAGGVDSRLIADRLHGLFPRARVLVVIREQKSFIRSMYSQYITDGGDQSLSRLLNPPQPDVKRLPGWDFEFLAYHRLIHYYRDRFGPDRVLVLPFERLCRDPHRFVADILRFCGLRAEASAALPATVVNPRRPLTLQAVTRLINRHLVRSQLSSGGFVAQRPARAALARLAPVFARLTPAFVERALERRLRRIIAAAVGDRYAASNRETAALIGIDLSAYDYPCAADPD